MNKVEKLVFNHVRKANKNREVEAITGQSLLKEDLWLDSITMVALFTDLSRELNVDLLSFDDAELVNLRCVDDLTRLFGQKAYQPSH